MSVITKIRSIEKELEAARIVAGVNSPFKREHQRRADRLQRELTAAKFAGVLPRRRFKVTTCTLVLIGDKKLFDWQESLNHPAPKKKTHEVNSRARDFALAREQLRKASPKHAKERIAFKPIAKMAEAFP